MKKLSEEQEKTREAFRTNEYHLKYYTQIDLCVIFDSLSADGYNDIWLPP